jgi:hypothetical protein
VKDAQRLELQHCRLRRVNVVRVRLRRKEDRRKRERWHCDNVAASAADQAEEVTCVFSSIQTALLLAKENKQEARQKVSVRKGLFEKLLWAIVAVDVVAFARLGRTGRFCFARRFGPSSA